MVQGLHLCRYYYHDHLHLSQTRFLLCVLITTIMRALVANNNVLQEHTFILNGITVKAHDS